MDRRCISWSRSKTKRPLKGRLRAYRTLRPRVASSRPVLNVRIGSPSPSRWSRAKPPTEGGGPSQARRGPHGRCHELGHWQQPEARVCGIRRSQSPRAAGGGGRSAVGGPAAPLNFAQHGTRIRWRRGRHRFGMCRCGITAGAHWQRPRPVRVGCSCM